MSANEKSELRNHLHAAVFSGGGSKIMIQLRALEKLLLREPTYNPFFFAGVSCGSLIASFLAAAGASPEDFSQKVFELHKLLFSLEGNKSIWKRRFGYFRVVNLIAGYFLRGIWDTEPLWELINRSIDQKELIMSPRDLFVGAFHLNTQTYVEQGKHNSQIKKWILASASFPVVFPPVEIGWNDVHNKPERYSDGGIKNILPSECVLRHRPSRIDIFLTSSVVKKKDYWVEVDRLDQVATSTLMGAYGEIFEEDLEPYFRYQEKYPEAVINIHAPEPYDEVNGLDFSPELMMDLYQIGDSVSEYCISRVEDERIFNKTCCHERPKLLHSGETSPKDTPIN